MSSWNEEIFLWGLAVRVTAVLAPRADFEREVDACIGDEHGPEPRWQAWAFRLSSELRSVLDGLQAARGGRVERGAGPQAEAARVVLARCQGCRQETCHQPNEHDRAGQTGKSSMTSS